MKNPDNGGKIIGALLIGVAIGAAIGILYAPDKGSETRHNISLKGARLTKTVKEKIKDSIKEAKLMVGAVKDRANGWLENKAATSEKHI